MALPVQAPLPAPTPQSARTYRAARQVLVALAPAFLAAVLAVLAHLLGFQGGDEAAQSYRVREVLSYGVVLWDSGWYGGNLPMSYSVAFPLLGAAVGLLTTAVVSAGAATYAFDRLVRTAWGRRGAASWYFAVSVLLPVTIGQLPFLAGEALALLALVALQQRRIPLAAVLVAVSALFSPLAAVFAALACLAWALDRQDKLAPFLRRHLPEQLMSSARSAAETSRAAWHRRPSRSPGPMGLIVTAGAALAVIGAITLLFPGSGPFPYPSGSLLLTLLLCATVVTPLVPSNSVLRWGAALYALAAVASFLIPNAVGGNAIRLAQAIGVPILAGLLFLPDPAAVGASAPFARAAVAGSPGGGDGGSGDAPAARRAWAAVVRALSPVDPGGLDLRRGPFPASSPGGRLAVGDGAPRAGTPVPVAAGASAFSALAQATPPAAAAAVAPRRGRPRILRLVAALVVLGGFATWQWAPGLNAIQSPTTDAAASASYYQPLLHQILSRSGGPVRVEAVPTKDHWESAYLAPTVSLARGWERQLDLADNPIFYKPDALTDASYAAWLRANGVSWVALPDTSLDYASVGEAALLRRGGVPGLRPVWSSAHWELWRVLASPGLVSGPGRLTVLDPNHLALAITHPAVVTMRVRYTSLWDLEGPARGAAHACVRPSPDGWTEVVASSPGTVHLGVSLFDGRSANCRSH